MCVPIKRSNLPYAIHTISPHYAMRMCAGINFGILRNANSNNTVFKFNTGIIQLYINTYTISSR